MKKTMPVNKREVASTRETSEWMASKGYSILPRGKYYSNRVRSRKVAALAAVIGCSKDRVRRGLEYLGNGREDELIAALSK